MEFPAVLNQSSDPRNGKSSGERVPRQRDVNRERVNALALKPIREGIVIHVASIERLAGTPDALPGFNEAPQFPPLIPGLVDLGDLMSAAVRCFGSWSKAMQAAGVDPSRFQRVARWTETSVIEAILKRALTNAPLGSQSTQPHSLVTAGTKFFGSWPAALIKAGLNPADHVRPCQQCRQPGIAPPSGVAEARDRPSHPPEPGGRRLWSNERVIEAIHLRHREGRKLTSVAVYEECRSLHTAGIRRFGNWRNSLIAAGLDPDVVASRRGRPPTSNGPVVAKHAETLAVLRHDAALQTPAAPMS